MRNESDRHDLASDLVRTNDLATSFGWLRRLDLDSDQGFVWERPSGDLVIVPTSAVPRVIRLKDLIAEAIALDEPEI